MSKMSEARFSGKKVTDSPAKARFSSRLLEGRNVHAAQKRGFELSRRGFLVKAFVGALVGGAALAAPSLLRADEKVAASAQEDVDSYVTLEELKPYFENAKRYMVSPDSGTELGNKHMKKYDTKDYWFVVTTGNTRGISVQVLRGEDTVATAGFPGIKPEEFNMMVVDFGDDNPLIKGELLIFATSDEVATIYNSKQTGEHFAGTTKLWDKGLARGPVKIGVDYDNEGIAVMVVPESGDKFAQVVLAYTDNDHYEMGASYTSTFSLGRAPGKLAKL